MNCRQCGGRGKRKNELLQIENCRACGGSGLRPEHKKPIEYRVGKKRDRLGAELKSEIMKMKLNGERVEDIRKILKVSLSTIYKVNAEYLNNVK